MIFSDCGTQIKNPDDLKNVLRRAGHGLHRADRLKKKAAMEKRLGQESVEQAGDAFMGDWPNACLSGNWDA